MDETSKEATVSDLIAVIRTDSAEERLSALSALQQAFPGLDPEAIIEGAEATDLKKMRGSRETYFFSELSMTEAYAIHLFRIAEKDPVRLVAETVRDESRIYPRPTDIRSFFDPPFGLTERELEDTLGRMSLRPDCEDIKLCQASNGARYLYSSLHLGSFHAESLAEWIEVGQKENP